jgi:hypothetical protein
VRFVTDTMGHAVIEAPDDIQSGANEMRGYEQRDRAVDPTGGFAKPFTLPVMSRQEIKERFEEQERTKSRIYDVLQREKVPPLFQYSFSNCWANGPVDCIQVSEVLMGRGYTPLSAPSASSPIKNGRDVGGWGIECVKFAASQGIAEQKYWPANSLDRKEYDTPESRASRATHKIGADGWLDLPEGDWMAVFTCVALGLPGSLAHMEWQHLVGSWVAGGIASNGELMVLCRNSGYGRDSTGHSWIRESFGRPDEALAINVVAGG